MRAPKETKAEAKARRERIWKEAEQRARDLEGVWERTIQSLLDRQMESVLARLEGKRGRQMLRAAAPDASNVFDAAYWEQETADTVRSLYEQVTMVAGTAQATALGGTFKMTDAWVRDFIGKRVQKLSPQVTSTTYDAIKRQLADGAAAGEGIPELATRIRGLFQQTYKSRAQTVARTEVISAYNGTAQSFAMQSELVGGLEWIATMDARTRLSHAEMDGHVIHKGGAFVVDGHTLTYPGDPDAAGPNPAAQIINCRCTVAPVLREDMPAGMKEKGTPALEDSVERVLALPTGWKPLRDFAQLLGL